MRRGRLARWSAALIVSGLLPSASDLRADQLVADLSAHLIAITTAFVGTKVVLFGTSDGTGHVVVTVEGPSQDTVVRRKGRIGPIWVNRESLAFANVPEYYAIASSAPLPKIARPDVRGRLQLGVDYLELQPLDAAGLDPGEITAFTHALIRNKQRQGLYSVEPAEVSFLGPRLFRTTFDFPANVPPGIYRVQVFQLQDGQVTDAQRSTLVISKIGFEADIFDFAHQQSVLYGLLAVAVAVAAGWLAGVIFRRG
ncbi:MAG: TIGR02186 family protein [Geminicoccaceae bacterium]